MALTFATTIVHESVFGNKRVVTADVVATGTGTATGDAFAPSALGLRGFDILMIGNSQTLSATGTATTAEDVGYHVAYDYVNEKIIMTYSDLNGSADGPSIEVADTTNLTGVRVRALIIGY